MKKLAFIICLIATTTNSYSQVDTKKETSKNGFQYYAEFSPFLAAFSLVSINAGVEFRKYQIGVSFTKGNHHFSHGLNKSTFKNFGDLHFLHNQSEEVSIKRYFKDNRKGLYIGLLLNLTHWEVQNQAENVSVNKIGKYATIFTGYRWFPPFKNNDIFYIEPNFGVSVRLNGDDYTEVGTKSFTFNQPFELTPNIYMGARFRIGNKIKK
jgi:hypothetical protein